MKIAEAILKGVRPPGIYRLTTRVKPAALFNGLERAGWRSFYIDGLQVYDKASFLKTCAEAFHFPGYFGNNWDAFEECIRDLPPAQGYVILYDQVAQFALKEPEDWAVALDILAATVSFWNKTGSPLYVLLRHAEKYAPNTRAWQQFQ